jgi:hypothetical protein
MLNTIASIHGTGAVAGDYQSIATTTLGAGGASSITFSSIPATFQHLQIRVFAQTNRATFGGDGVQLQLGTTSADTGSNYAYHDLSGNGSTAGAQGQSTQTKILLGANAGVIGSSAGSAFGVIVIDILDYADTNKYKTVRSLGGMDDNSSSAGFGRAADLTSGLWMSTSATGTIKLMPFNGSNFNQYSSFALYGVK